jgi:Nucleotidyltransferase domain
MSLSDLLERAREVFMNDGRVRALWLAGSRGRGNADRWSDLDLVVTVADSDFEAFASDWHGWLADITPTVFARQIPGLPGSCYTITPGWECLDIVAETASSLLDTPFRERVVVFDRDALAATLPQPMPAATSPVRIEFLVSDHFRSLGLLAGIVGREDWLLGQEAVHGMRLSLVQLYLEANRPQLQPAGPKRRLGALTPEQRGAIEALELPRPGRESVIHGHLAVARTFLPAARELCARLAINWPDLLEAATRDHLRRELALEI